MPYALDGNPSQSEISEAINYLLSNFSTGVTSDPNTGEVKGPTGAILGYLYKYMGVKYADSFDGSVNFSNSPTNRQYFGLRNNDDAAESSNYTDYIWNKVTGGFGTTKFLWYVSTGGRQIQFAVSTTAPDTGWLIDPGTSIDLDVVTSGNIPVIAETFFSYFTPSTLQVPRSGAPLAPTFTGVQAALYSIDKGSVIGFTDAQTDSNVGFINNSWRIGNSSTTGNGDISYTNITVGSPTDGGDFAIWPAPTAMSANPAYISVPIRYKNNLGVVTQASVATVQFLFADPGAQGYSGPTIDISGYTGFNQNSGGLFTPSTATLSAVTTNVTSPTYSWAISGGTPTSATTSSVVITPNSSATSVIVTLTVNGSNLITPGSKTISMPVVFDGAVGQAGANGVMSAFPSIYQWTGSSTPPTRPSTTSTYTWSTGAYTAPSGWASTVPSNTTAGNYLWAITFPLTVSATTTTSTLDWTSTANPIIAIAFNGTVGPTGSAGSNGAATFVITRTANDGSAPTNSEVSAVLGRTPVAGDICTVSYNSSNNAIVYRYITSWTTFVTYITGSLIVSGTITGDKITANTITGDRIAANTVTATNINSNNLTIRDGSGTVLFGAGTNLNYANITPATGWLNSNVTINEITGVISLGGAGGGSVTAVTPNNKISSSNISSYMASAAIGTAYIGNAAITTALISNAAITTALIGDAQITNAKIGTAEVSTLSIAGQAVTIPSATSSSSTSNSLTHTYTSSGSPTIVNFAVIFYPGTYSTGGSQDRTFTYPVTVTLQRGSTTIFTFTVIGGDLVTLDIFGVPVVPSKIFTIPYLDNPSSGSVTYTLSVSGSGSTSTLSCGYKIINTLEVKR
jgi:hypothetical protein